MIDSLGCTVCNSTADGALTVKDSQRIFYKSLLTGSAKLIFMALEVVSECIVILGSAVGTADGVDIKACLETELLYNSVTEGDNFSIGTCRLPASVLGVFTLK